MERKTQDVKDFVERILGTLPNPLIEDVTDQVFLAIERNSQLREEYCRLCKRHGRRVLHSQGPQWIRKALGMPDKRGIGTSKSKLIPTRRYSKFVIGTMVHL